MTEHVPLPPLQADAEALQRIARVLLRQVKRGGPSNFEQVAGHYLDAEDADVFRRLVAPDATLRSNP